MLLLSSRLLSIADTRVAIGDIYKSRIYDTNSIVRETRFIYSTAKLKDH